MNKKDIIAIIPGEIIIAFLIILLPVITFADRGNDLDEFDDLGLESLNKQKSESSNSSSDNKKVILYDDNLYLLDDDFDFGEDELDLLKLELDPKDMETAKEYELFLNAFFENSITVGTNSSKKFSQSKSKLNTNTNPNISSSPYRAPMGKLGIGVSTIFGATIPVTMEGLSTGSNFGLRLKTPFLFNIAGKEINVGTEIYFSNMANTNGDKYKITNLILNASIFPLKSIEFRTGFGFTPSSIGSYNITALAFPVDINYYLPLKISGFRFALNLHAQRTFGYPTKEGIELGDSTDFMYLGLLINTPFII